MSAPILLTGGTGTLGRQVAPLLIGAGHRVRLLSRREHADTTAIEYVTGDLIAGTGIETAVAGIETVVHLAGGPKGDDIAARHLVRAAAAAGVRHLVHISVIGAARMPLGYFRAKAGAERAIAESGVPHTILRAAQFHELTLTAVRAMARLPVVPAPRDLRFEPVDSAAVAARIAELALGTPAGVVDELAGPRVYPMADLVRGYLAAQGKRRPILPVPLAGKVGRAYRAGVNLAADPVRSGRSWDEFLSAQASTRSGAAR
ncbi:SDR family oxidoreductase [Microlunatus speluncae]|uniref:SDR family oxidoreductase n=1 Tax=Microlunatus speluncae TaxID=2594267 RepID=UPI00126652BE|nr:NAD(P)H-binding protein [Microlunatus speluncae]